MSTPSETQAETFGGYILYPLALHVPPVDRWQAVVVISRTSGEGDSTSTRSRAFPGTPVIFETADEAREYALRYGRMLISGSHSELPG